MKGAKTLSTESEKPPTPFGKCSDATFLLFKSQQSQTAAISQEKKENLQVFTFPCSHTDVHANTHTHTNAKPCSPRFLVFH